MTILKLPFIDYTVKGIDLTCLRELKDDLRIRLKMPEYIEVEDENHNKSNSSYMDIKIEVTPEYTIRTLITSEDTNDDSGIKIIYRFKDNIPLSENLRIITGKCESCESPCKDRFTGIVHVCCNDDLIQLILYTVNAVRDGIVYSLGLKPRNFGIPKNKQVLAYMFKQISGEIEIQYVEYKKVYERLEELYNTQGIDIDYIDITKRVDKVYHIRVSRDNTNKIIRGMRYNSLTDCEIADMFSNNEQKIKTFKKWLSDFQDALNQSCTPGCMGFIVGKTMKMSVLNMSLTERDLLFGEDSPYNYIHNESVPKLAEPAVEPLEPVLDELPNEYREQEESKTKLPDGWYVESIDEKKSKLHFEYRSKERYKTLSVTKSKAEEILRELYNLVNGDTSDNKPANNIFKSISKGDEYVKIKQSELDELKNQVKSLEELLNISDSQFADNMNVIDKLRNDNHELSAKLQNAREALQARTTEQEESPVFELYDGELQHAILQAVTFAVKQWDSGGDSRRRIRDVLLEYIPTVKENKIPDTIQEELIKIFDKYSNQKAIINAVNQLGLECEAGGDNHYSIWYKEKPEYRYTFAATPSDHRGYTNSIHKMMQILYW